MLSVPNTTILYQWHDTKPALDSGIELLNWLSRDVGWATVTHSGPESDTQPGDHVLLSRRVVSYTFEEEGITLSSTADNSVLLFKRGTNLHANKDTIIYEWLDLRSTEEVHESGLILVKSTQTKEDEPKWALVHAAGKDTECAPGDHILLGYKHDCYVIENVVPGVQLHNAHRNEVIAIKRKP